ncbi:hypothetical protein NDU88_004760 [Pleurodeles waltl]|uniref:Uncharacterized protein n=1 Tax=Pleurodeles waltl TaxID=8319 RepID=A0AAV7VJV0_PLEWA|nr:hypothetical protein NDU88_004760 [Pleurodeles waltl]
MESCPGGTAGRTAEQEGTSDPDIRVTRTEISGGEKREWRAMPGAEGGTESRENDEREDSNDGRRSPETGGQLGTDPKSPTETLRRNEEHRHLPGGAWHTQVRSYLKLKLLPEWMRGGRKLEETEEGLGVGD